MGTIAVLLYYGIKLLVKKLVARRSGEVLSTAGGEVVA